MGDLRSVSLRRWQSPYMPGVTAEEHAWLYVYVYYNWQTIFSRVGVEQDDTKALEELSTRGIPNATMITVQAARNFVLYQVGCYVFCVILMLCCVLQNEAKRACLFVV